MPSGKGREDRGAAGRTGPGVKASSAILDAAFRKAYRATPHGDTAIQRARRRAQLKVVRSAAVTVRHLRLATKSLQRPGPTPFERELIARAFGVITLNRALTRVGRAEARIRGASTEEQRRIAKGSSRDDFANSVRRFYGRMASFLREVDPDLEDLRRIAEHLRRRPKLTPDEPVVVVAGFPNVGKSSLVGALSTAKPRVAEHPFTTLSIAVGHADLGFDRLQVLDTPGVLGRARQENPAEVEADTAVHYAATLVVFLLDPSEQCGYPMPEQERLLERWRSELPGIPFIEIEGKADLRKTGSSRLAVSATSREGLEELRTRIQAALSSWRPPAIEPPPDADLMLMGDLTMPVEEPPPARRRTR